MSVNIQDQPLRSFVEEAPDTLIHTAILDEQGKIRQVNATWHQMAVRKEHPLVANALPDCEYAQLCRAATGEAETAGRQIASALEQILSGSAREFSCEYHLEELPQRRYFLVSISSLTGIQGALVTHLDITRFLSRGSARVQELITDLQTQKAELEIINANLQSIAMLDAMTGLRNYRAFREQFRLEFDRARRHHLPLSLILIDVDHFKTFNDTYGHPAGDEVLVQIARVMNEIARDTDFLARYGGEEFAMVLPNTHLEGAVSLAQRVRAGIQTAEWPRRPVTASFGVASMTTHTRNPAQLLQEADSALYASKQAGRNCVQYHRITGVSDTGIPSE